MSETRKDEVLREVRGLLVGILNNHPERGRIVHAMGGTYQTYGDLVDAIFALSRATPPAAEPR